MLHLEPSPAEPDVTEALRAIAARQTSEEMTDDCYWNTDHLVDRDLIITAARIALGQAVRTDI